MLSRFAPINRSPGAIISSGSIKLIFDESPPYPGCGFRSALAFTARSSRGCRLDAARQHCHADSRRRPTPGVLAGAVRHVNDLYDIMAGFSSDFLIGLHQISVVKGGPWFESQPLRIMLNTVDPSAPRRHSPKKTDRGIRHLA